MSEWRGSVKQCITELPLFAGCEIQQLFQDFPESFQVNLGPSLSPKTLILTHFIKNPINRTHYTSKIYYSNLLSWLNPNNEKQPMTDRFRRIASG